MSHRNASGDFILGPKPNLSRGFWILHEREAKEFELDSHEDEAEVVNMTRHSKEMHTGGGRDIQRSATLWLAPAEMNSTVFREEFTSIPLRNPKPVNTQEFASEKVA